MDQLLSPSSATAPCILRVGKRNYFDLRLSPTEE
jgi:hypothetical protein